MYRKMLTILAPWLCLLQAAPDSSAQAKPFMPGVRINWQLKQVEVDSKVVLREGMLELFACAPNTREHESIISITGKVSHVFQALGLLGLEPGRPPRWDHDKQVGIPASGPPLEVSVRYQVGGEVRVSDVHEWLWDDKTDRQAPRLRWVFSGSRPTDDGTLAAQLEGTVVSLVDFDSSLISLPQSYSADNLDLWLRPDPERIPPVGSSCVLLIKVVDPSLRVARLTRFGRILYEGEVLGRLSFARVLEADLEAHTDLSIELRIDPWALSADRLAVQRLIGDAGVPADRVNTVVEREAPQSLDVDGMLILLKKHGRLPTMALQGIVEKYHGLRERIRALHDFADDHGDELRQRFERLVGARDAADGNRAEIGPDAAGDHSPDANEQQLEKAPQ